MAKKYLFQDPALSSVTDVSFKSGNGEIPREAIESMHQVPLFTKILQWRMRRKKTKGCFGKQHSRAGVPGEDGKVAKFVTARKAERMRQESVAAFQKQEARIQRQKAAIADVETNLDKKVTIGS